MTPRSTGVQVPAPQVSHSGSISVTSGGKESWGVANSWEAKAVPIGFEKQVWYLDKRTESGGGLASSA